MKLEIDIEEVLKQYAEQVSRVPDWQKPNPVPLLRLLFETINGYSDTADAILEACDDTVAEYLRTRLGGAE